MFSRLKVTDYSKAIQTHLLRRDDIQTLEFFSRELQLWKSTLTKLKFNLLQIFVRTVAKKLSKFG